METTRKIELLAPARDLTTGLTAVDCGADAVYIGGPGFGARKGAGNSLEDVAELVRYARPFGVRIYATLNTLLFEDELTEARRLALGLLNAGVDALIVQDMAWLRMGLAGVEWHASTQTSNIRPEDVAFLGRAGFRRVILERALTLSEIRAIRAAAPPETELEAFVHGAICVGHSGRCFLCRAADPTRSGNRGDCSQPCRLSYDLVDEKGKVLVRGKHLLSVRDLDLGERIGELMDAGVGSFKIEGRLKDENYVRNVVSHYRGVIDGELALRPGLRRSSVGLSVPDFVPDPAKSFMRGATQYFFDGPARGITSFDTPKAMGEPIGRVERTGCDRTGNRWFTLSGGGGELFSGDGICFISGGELRGTNINRAEGGRVYPDKSEGIGHGVNIYRNFDRTFVRSLESSRTRRRIGARAQISTTHSSVEITFTDRTGLSVSVAREGVFEPARDHAKMAATAREQLTRSGDTIFEVEGVEITGEMLFVPVSVLSSMRREALERLTEARAELPPERHPAAEDMSASAPRIHLGADENVTNSLAERFWRDHGVTEIAPALELRGARSGDTVMRTPYCIRRETGECLREGSKRRGKLYLERGSTRWELGFECDKCEMTVKKI
jgi:putative protease